MNIFNRIIMIILLLCLFVSSIIIAVNIFADLFTWEAIFDRILRSIETTNPYITLAVFIAIAVVSLIILVFEFRRRRLKVANVASDQSGKTMVTLKTVSSQIRDRLLELDDVTDPRVKIIPRRDGIIINASSKLTKGIGVADKTKEIREEVSDFASKTLGFKVIKSNYTATGFVPAKVKKVKKDFLTKEPEVSVKEEEPDIPSEPEETPISENNSD
jgi:hypothetical protein